MREAANELIPSLTLNEGERADKDLISSAETARGRPLTPLALTAPGPSFEGPEAPILLGDSLTVELRTLTPLVQVRILVPQPI